MILLISYDLNGYERPSSYTAVKNYIEKHSISSIRPLYSQWFAETAYSAQQWVDALIDNGLIDSNDRLFVCRINRPYQGWLSEAHWNWLNPRI